MFVVGRSAAPGNNFAVEDGFGGEVQIEDIYKAVTGAGSEHEFVAAKEIVWRPWSVYGDLERWCFAKGRDLKRHCLGMTGAADWMTEESHLEVKGGKKGR